MRITYKMRSYIPRGFEKLSIYVTIEIKIVVFVLSFFFVLPMLNIESALHLATFFSMNHIHSFCVTNCTIHSFLDSLIEATCTF